MSAEDDILFLAPASITNSRPGVENYLMCTIRTKYRWGGGGLSRETSI